MNAVERINELRAEAVSAIAAAGDSAAIEELRVKYLGRKSELTGILRGIGELPADERGPVGSGANEARGALEKLLATHPNFQGLDLPPSWRDFARMAAPLVGVPRHLSVHPGGVVIVPTALTDYVPIEPAVKALEDYPDLTVPVIQLEKDGAEDAGLVKIDLLGNRSLAVIRDAIAAVQLRISSAVIVPYGCWRPSR